MARAGVSRGMVAALLVALALNGCSEDRAATTASTTTRTAQAADCSDDLVACARKSTLADAVPTKATKATGTPIVLGMINQENTPLGSYPELSSASKAAAAFVNAELGGIGGRPIQIEVCNTEFSPEGSTACAQKFIQEGVPAVLGGIDVFGNGIDTLQDNKIPYVGGIPVSTQSVSLPGSYQWSGGTWGATIAFAHHAATVLKAKKVAIAYPEFDPITSSANYGKKVLEDEGVEQVQMIPYPITATDLTSPLQAAAAAKPDALIMLAADTGCKGTFDGRKTVGLDAQLYLVGACATPKILAEAGNDKTEGTILNVENEVDTTAPDVDFSLYQAVVEKYGDGFDPVGAGTVTFRAFMNLYRVMAGIDGKVTPEAIGQALDAQKNTPSFTGHAYTCDHKQLAGLPALCSPQQVLAQIKDGTLTQITDWIDVGKVYGDN